MHSNCEKSSFSKNKSLISRFCIWECAKFTLNETKFIFRTEERTLKQLYSLSLFIYHRVLNRTCSNSVSKKWKIKLLLQKGMHSKREKSSSSKNKSPTSRFCTWERTKFVPNETKFIFRTEERTLKQLYFLSLFIYHKILNYAYSLPNFVSKKIKLL